MKQFFLELLFIKSSLNITIIKLLVPIKSDRGRTIFILLIKRRGGLIKGDDKSNLLRCHYQYQP